MAYSCLISRNLCNFYRELKYGIILVKIGTQQLQLKNFFIFLSFLVLYSGRLSAQTPKIDDIILAIQNGNADELSIFFNSNIDLTLVDDDNGYSKVQATMVMKDFFIHYSPLKVILQHSGTQKDGSTYAILNYRTLNKENFRVVFYLKPYSGVLLINELRFDLIH